MKYDYDITKQFQDDLIKAYNSVARTCWTQREAYEKAVKLPAPRYYITPKQAAQVISPMINGDFDRVNMMIPNRKRMYYSLMEKVIELSEKRAFAGKSLAYVLKFAVISPAPEFFVEWYTLHKIRGYIKNGHLDFYGRTVNVRSRDWSYERLKKKRAELKAYRESVRKTIQSEEGVRDGAETQKATTDGR